MFYRAIVASLALLTASLCAVADDFSDFRIPDHRVMSLTGEADIHGTTHNEQESYKYDRNYLDGNLGTSLYWLRDSDRFMNSLSLSLRLRGEMERERRESASDDWRTERDDELLESLSATWWSRLYPWSLPFGIEGSASGHTLASQEWTLQESMFPWQDTTLAESDGSANARRQGIVSISYGVGYGRVRDATAVYDVRILEDRLLATGALSAALLPQTRRDLAAQFYARSDYSTRYEREDKYFWEDIETVLEKDPAFVPGRFDAYSVYRIAESIDGGRLLRRRGFFFGPLIRAGHFHSWQRVNPNNMPYTINGTAGEQVRWGVNGQYFRPLSLRWQFDFDGELLWLREPRDDGYSLSLHADATYILHDDWRYSAIADFYREVSRPSDQHNGYYRDGWWLGLGSTLSYYIEDRLSLNLTVTQRHQRQHYGSELDSRIGTSADTGFALGVGYQIRGVNSPKPTRTRIEYGEGSPTKP